MSAHIDLSKLPPVLMALRIIGRWFSIAATLAGLAVLFSPDRSAKIPLLAALVIFVVGSVVHIVISLARRRRDHHSHNAPSH